MKRHLFGFFLAALLGAGAAIADAWELQSAYVQAQPQKGAPGPGADRGGQPRDARGDRREDRRDRMTEDERRALQRDVEKANRELYGRRPQK